MPFELNDWMSGAGQSQGQWNRQMSGIGAYTGQDWQQNRRRNPWTGGGGGGGFGGGGGYGGGGGGGGNPWMSGGGGQENWTIPGGTHGMTKMMRGGEYMGGFYGPEYTAYSDQARRSLFGEMGAKEQQKQAASWANPFSPGYTTERRLGGGGQFISKPREVTQNLSYEQAGSWGGQAQRANEMIQMRQYLSQLAAGGPGQKFINLALEAYLRGDTPAYQKWIKEVFNPTPV